MVRVSWVDESENVRKCLLLFEQEEPPPFKG